MGSFQVLTSAGARMQHDQFPSTHATQIIELLASGAAGQSKVRSDVMARYHAGGADDANDGDEFYSQISSRTRSCEVKTKGVAMIGTSVIELRQGLRATRKPRSLKVLAGG